MGQQSFNASQFGASLVCNGRLTTESGVAISTTDRIAQSTIYWTPYLGNQISVFNGTIWIRLTSAQISLALSGLTSGKNYDVFAYNNAGVLTLELSSAWLSDTVRATALALQDGVFVKSGDATRRYLGTIRTTGTTTTEDSGGGTTTQVGGKRFVWNYYNRVRRIFAVVDTAASWSYATATWRSANGAANNKTEFVVGDTAALARIAIYSSAYCVGNTTGAAIVGVGLDSTTVVSGFLAGLYVAGTGVQAPITCFYHDFPGPGYHVANWLEKGGGGTCTWIGGTGAAGEKSGMQGFVEG